MHPEIEKLIELALADGEVSGKEWAVILRKAESLGEDKDEIEVIINGKLSQIRKQPSSSVAQKQGTIKRCPSCGAPLVAFTTSCAACHHELADIDASLTIKNLVDRFEAIELIHNIGVSEKLRRKGDTIREFAVPHTREELQQLIYYIKPKIVESKKSDPNIEDWRAKFAEIIGRARNAYKDDPKKLAEFDNDERGLKTSLSSIVLIKAKRNPGKVAGGVAVFTLLIMAYLVSQAEKAKIMQCEAKYEQAAPVEKARLEQVLANVNKEFSEKQYTVALSHLTQLKWEYASECKEKETLQLKTLWDEKKKDISTLIQKNIDAELAEAQAAAAALAAEKQAVINQQIAKDQADTQKSGTLKHIGRLLIARIKGAKWKEKE